MPLHFLLELFFQSAIKKYDLVFGDSKIYFHLCITQKVELATLCGNNHEYATTHLSQETHLNLSGRHVSDLQRGVDN